MIAAGKSIAVLPFENLSRDPDNAYFADGIQDEILTRLAKIADLKVISRTSTHRYKSSPEDLPKIAQQLGVAHILEGSVQKSGEQVRVTVQLIRAANDSHLWAETYDRKLTDIFAVESEVAEKIARLVARPTDRRRAAGRDCATDGRPGSLRSLSAWTCALEQSDDFAASHGKERPLSRSGSAARPELWSCLGVTSAAHTFIYAEYERTPQRLAQAKAALDTAFGSIPIRARRSLHWECIATGVSGITTARSAAFQQARQRAANRVEAIEFSAYVKRRQGKWNEALALHAESLQLDPRNPILLSESALTYRAMRRFKEARDLVNRALEIEPASPNPLVQKAEIYLAQGDLTSAARFIERLPLDGQDPTSLAPESAFGCLTGNTTRRSTPYARCSTRQRILRKCSFRIAAPGRDSRIARGPRGRRKG